MIISKQHENDNNGDQNSFITGMLLQFVNPKAILYGITIVSTFILPYHTSNLSLIGYSFFLAVIGFMGTISWSVFGSVFQRFLSKYRNQFQVVMALLLVFTAISILVH